MASPTPVFFHFEHCQAFCQDAILMYIPDAARHRAKLLFKKLTPVFAFNIVKMNLILKMRRETAMKRVTKISTKLAELLCNSILRPQTIATSVQLMNNSVMLGGGISQIPQLYCILPKKR